MSSEAKPLTPKEIAARISAHLRPAVVEDGEDPATYAAWKPRSKYVLVVYGLRQGDFQSISEREAVEYLAWLDAGNKGAPWEMANALAG